MPSLSLSLSPMCVCVYVCKFTLERCLNVAWVAYHLSGSLCEREQLGITSGPQANVSVCLLPSLMLHVNPGPLEKFQGQQPSAPADDLTTSAVTDAPELHSPSATPLLCTLLKTVECHPQGNHDWGKHCEARSLEKNKRGKILHSSASSIPYYLSVCSNLCLFTEAKGTYSEAVA